MKLKKLLASLLVFATLCTFNGNISFASDYTNAQNIRDMQDLRKEKQFTECIDLADSILANDKLFMEAYYNKSMACFQSNKISDAAEVLEEQLKYNPNNEAALYNAACASSLLGKNKEAIEYIKRLLVINVKKKKDIAKDKDFDKIRETDAYKKLMDISVRVGGDLLEFDVPPVVINDRTMLPMRSIFEALDAQITWDEGTNTVTAVKNDKNISLTIGNKIAKVDGLVKEMEVPPILKDDRTLVPVRFISEALNSKVDWDADNNLVDIAITAPNGTGSDYDNIKKEIDTMTVVSVVDGAWTEPFRIGVKQGITYIIAKDKKALDLFNSLDDASRSKYMYETTYTNYALVVGCDPVHMKFVYGGKLYYAGDMYYDKKGVDIVLDYYHRGLPINVVKQYKSTFNYKDFYLLPSAEQTTSKIGD